jgi:hypothetical protein
MPASARNNFRIERSLIMLAVILLLFVSPLTEFWAALDAPWFSPYLIWLVAIILSWSLQRSLRKHGI